MLSAFSLLWANLNRESDYNPNVAHCFMSLGVEQRILGMEVEGVRASSHSRENLSSGLLFIKHTLFLLFLLLFKYICLHFPPPFLLDQPIPTSHLWSYPPLALDSYFWTVSGRALTKFTPLVFSASHSPFCLTNAFSLDMLILLSRY